MAVAIELVFRPKSIFPEYRSRVWWLCLIMAVFLMLSFSAVSVYASGFGGYISEQLIGRSGVSDSSLLIGRSGVASSGLDVAMEGDVVEEDKNPGTPVSVGVKLLNAVVVLAYVAMVLFTVVAIGRESTVIALLLMVVAIYVGEAFVVILQEAIRALF